MKSKLHIAIIMLAVSAVAIAPTSARANIITNGDFESWTAGAPAGWTATGQNSSGATTAQYVQTNLGTGTEPNYAFTFSKTGSGIESFLNQTISPDQGITEFTLTFDFAATDPSGSSDAANHVANAARRNLGFYILGTDTITGTEKTYISAIVTPGSGTGTDENYDKLSLKVNGASGSATTLGANIFDESVYNTSTKVWDALNIYTVSVHVVFDGANSSYSISYAPAGGGALVSLGEGVFKAPVESDGIVLSGITFLNVDGLTTITSPSLIDNVGLTSIPEPASAGIWSASAALLIVALVRRRLVRG